jgi:hypothetical protein
MRAIAVSAGAGWVAAIVAVASPARAQLYSEYELVPPPPQPPAVEIAPMVGYAFRGSASEPYGYGASDIAASATYGAAVNLGNWYGGHLALGYRFQDTGVEYAPALGAAYRGFGLTLHHMQVGGEYDILPGDVRPFVGGGVGVALLSPQTNLPDEVRFEFSVQGGVKLFVTDHVGVRLQGQVAVIVLDASSDIFCNEQCVTVVSGLTAMPQLALTAGPILAF